MKYKGSKLFGKKPNFFFRKAIDPIITVVLLITISVIIVSTILLFSKSFATNTLNKATINKNTEKSDIEFYIYTKDFKNGTIQFNYTPPNNLREEVTILRYKIITDTFENQEIEITRYILRPGQNMLALTDFDNLDVNNYKINIQFLTSNNKYIILKNIINVSQKKETQIENCQTPIFDLESGDIDYGSLLTISSENDTNIYYTINGADPDEESNLYDSPISIDQNLTLKAIAVGNNCLNSDIAIANYIIIPTEKCLDPIILPTSGIIFEDTNVSITSDCDLIYYTIDDSNPTRESNLYISPIIISNNTTIKAISVKDYYIDSDVVTENYVYQEPIIENINLIINSDAELGDFTGWTTSSQNCSSGWCIMGDPGERAFCSSYPSGMVMSQIIDLTNNTIQNYSSEYLDSSPAIEINDYISAFWGGRYRIYVELRRNDNSVITFFDTGTQTYNNADWLRITNTFSNYGSGLRKIYFAHYGQDTRGWLGNYGTAFDDVSVYILGD